VLRSIKVVSTSSYTLLATDKDKILYFGFAGDVSVSVVNLTSGVSAGEQFLLARDPAAGKLTMTCGSDVNINGTADPVVSSTTSAKTVVLTVTLANGVVTDFVAFGDIDRQITLQAATSTESPVLLKGAVSQTADLQQWQNSSGTVLALITSAGGARFVPRVTTITSSGTPTINTDSCDAVTITAQAAAITSMTTNLSGTPNNFDRLTIRIKDNGTARAITWGASFVASGVALPTTTVANKVTTVGFIYDSVTEKWGCVASVVEL